MPANSIVDVLRGRSGIGISDNTYYSKDVGFRGTNGPLSEKVLVLVNGRQVYLDHYGMVVWDLIPVQLSEIKQIEIVKGPNTALFGFNAVSGVINIITKNPLYDSGGEMTFAAGSNSMTQGTYSQILKPTKKLGVRVSGGAESLDAFKVNGDLNTEAGVHNSSIKSKKFMADALYQLTDKTQVGFEVSRADDVSNMVVVSSQGGLEGEVSSFRGNIVSDTDYGLIELKGYINDASLTLDTASTASLPTEIISDSHTRVTVLSASDIFKIGTDHKFRLNAEWRHNSLTFEVPGGLGDNGNATSYNIASVGGLWDWTINDKWDLSTGLRLDSLKLHKEDNLISTNPYNIDQYDQAMTEYAYNIGLVYRPDAKDTFRLMHARGIDIPSLIEFGYQAKLLSGAISLVGNPTLDASHVLSYEFNYDRQIDAIHGKSRLAVFYQNYQEMQDGFAYTSGTTPPLYITGRNIGDLDVYGLEASLQGKTSAGIRWDMNYTLQLPKSDYNPSGATSNPFDGRNPKNMLNGHVGYDYDKWQFDGYAQFVSGYDSERSYTGVTLSQLKQIDSYLLLNGRIGYKYSDKVTLSVNGVGVAKDSYESSAVGDIDRRLWAQVSVKF